MQFHMMTLLDVLGKIRVSFQGKLSYIPGRVAQSVTCPATDVSLTADTGVASLIPARSHTFVEIDHEIVSTVILLNQEGLLSVTSESMCTKYNVLVNRLFKLAHEKVWFR